MINFVFIEHLNQTLEDQIYYEPNLGRDMANLVLSYGDSRCFIVRSRATAEDSKDAPFDIGFDRQDYICELVVRFCFIIGCHNSFYATIFNHV